MDSKLTYGQQLIKLYPELSLIVLLSLNIVLTVFKKYKIYTNLFFYLTFIALVVLLGFSFFHIPVSADLIFNKSYIIDSFGHTSKMLMILGLIGTLLINHFSNDLDNASKVEFVLLAICVTFGGFLLISANNILLHYLGLETMSIVSYAMSALRKRDIKSSEAGLKYSLYGGIASGIMLFGASHLYGVSGSLNFSAILESVQNLNKVEFWIVIPSGILFLVGMAYKLACVPFHMWSPDVYEGSPLQVTAFFSIIPKIAGMLTLFRLMQIFIGNSSPLEIYFIAILILFSALTMTVGNVTAIGQRSIKRMLAYSSIGHVGTIMMGVISYGFEGMGSIMFYLIAYLFMTLAAFFMLSIVHNYYGNDHFERFNGLLKRNPIVAICLIIVLFSLAGIPPFVGFIAKFNIIYSVILKKHFALAIIAGLNSVIALFYYLKLVRFMVFNPCEDETNIPGMTNSAKVLVVSLTVPVVLLGLYWDSVIKFFTVSEMVTL